MKKIILTALLISISIPVFAGVIQNVSNAQDGYGIPLGRVLDESGASVNQTNMYKVYSGTVNTSSVTANVYSDLGRYATGGFVWDTDTANSLSVSFSLDATNYGQQITLNAGEVLDTTYFQAFKGFKLLSTASASYQVVEY